MAAPRTVELDDELKRLQARWTDARPDERERIYAEEFGPRFASRFAELPYTV
jgi:hypothetical protein